MRQVELDGTTAEPVKLESAVVPPDFKRQKIPLEKGFSQMDWMRLKSTGKDINGNSLTGALSIHTAPP